MADGTTEQRCCGRRRHVVVRELKKASVAGAQRRGNKVGWDETRGGKGPQGD